MSAKRSLVITAILTVACSLTSCGSSKTVTIGEPGEKGVYRRQIDKANDVAGQASEKIKSGEKDVYGG